MVVEREIMLPREMDLKATHSGIGAMQRESKKSPYALWC